MIEAPEHPQMPSVSVSTTVSTEESLGFLFDDLQSDQFAAIRHEARRAAGIAEAVNKNAVLCKGGHHVAETMAAGGAALGCTLISEALPVKGLTIVGPLPGDLAFKIMYSAAIHAGCTKTEQAQAFLDFLTAPATKPRWTAAGMEPAF